MRIAVFLPNWIGDAVMATPAVRALRERYPNSRMLGVLKPYVAGVLDGSPWFDSVIHFDAKGQCAEGTLPVARRLREESIDLAVLFPNSFRSALTASLGRCRRVIGYARYGRGLLLHDALQPERDERGTLKPSPILDAYNLLAERAGAHPTRRMQLFTTARDEAAADGVWSTLGLAGREVIALNPGAAFGSSKYWSADAFAELARRLARERGAAIVVLCGPAERDLAEQIASRADEPDVHSLADFPLSIGLTKTVVQRADLLVTTDSGPRHFAAAFDRPVVTLFGPTHIAWTETYHPKAVHLAKKVDCGPCQKRICPLDHRCMTQLTPAEVFAASMQLLARFPAVREGRHAG